MPTSMREVAFSSAAPEIQMNVRGPTDGYAADIGLADRRDRAPEVVCEFRVNRSDISVSERGVERGEEPRVGVQIARVLRVEYSRDPVPAEAGAFVPENRDLGLVIRAAKAVQ